MIIEMTVAIALTTTVTIERQTRAPDELREHVLAELRGAEQVLARRAQILVR